MFINDTKEAKGRSTRYALLALILVATVSCTADKSEKIELASMTASELNDLMEIEGATKIDGPLPDGYDRGAEPQVTKITLPDEVIFDELFQVEVEFMTGYASLSKLIVQISGADSYFELIFSAVPNTFGTASFPCAIKAPANALANPFRMTVQLGGDNGPHGIAKTVELPISEGEEPPSCTENNGGCDENATCVPLESSLLCACNAGWVGSGEECVEIPVGMVYVEGGLFWRGCNSAVDTECSSDESPYRPVALDSFFIDKYEATAQEYDQCVDAGICSYNGSTSSPFRTYQNEKDTYPINFVDWTEAKTFCEEFKQKHLPTEAEWEKASRGTAGNTYPWGNDEATCDYAVMSGCSEETQAVGSIVAGKSSYGAMDMTGNVYEWVNDWYDPGYYANSPITNPTGPETGIKRVLRGGSFASDSFNLRSSKRNGSILSTARSHYFGFRCAQ